MKSRQQPPEYIRLRRIVIRESMAKLSSGADPHGDQCTVQQVPAGQRDRPGPCESSQARSDSLRDPEDEGSVRGEVVFGAAGGSARVTKTLFRFISPDAQQEVICYQLLSHNSLISLYAKGSRGKGRSPIWRRRNTEMRKKRSKRNKQILNELASTRGWWILRNKGRATDGFGDEPQRSKGDDDRDNY